MEILLQENNLFSRLHYFFNFYRILGEVKNEKKRSKICFFYCFYLVLFLQSAYFCFLFLFPANSLQEAILLGDYAYLCNFPRIGYFSAVGVLATSAYFLHLCYFAERSNEVLDTIYSFIFEQKSRILKQKFSQQNDKLLHKKMCKLAFNVHNLFQTFILAIGNIH